MQMSGFEIIKVHTLRQAGLDYLRIIRPDLRREARSRTDEILKLLEIVVVAKRLP